MKLQTSVRFIESQRSWNIIGSSRAKFFAGQICTSRACFTINIRESCDVAQEPGVFERFEVGQVAQALKPELRQNLFRRHERIGRAGRQRKVVGKSICR